MNVFKQKTVADKKNFGYYPYVFAAIILATLGLQLFNKLKPESTTSLLLPSADKIELANFQEIKTYTQTPVSLPEQLFGSSLYTIGVYPTSVNVWPAQTVSLVFVKDNARFATMEVFPNTSLEKLKKQYTTYPQETVVVNEKINGLLVRLRNGFECALPKLDSAPSMCLITTILLFEKNENLIQLSMDGNHITEGELIEMARSIK